MLLFQKTKDSLFTFFVSQIVIQSFYKSSLIAIVVSVIPKHPTGLFHPITKGGRANSTRLEIFDPSNSISFGAKGVEYFEKIGILRITSNECFVYHDKIILFWKNLLEFRFSVHKMSICALLLGYLSEMQVHLMAFEHTKEAKI